MPAKPRTAKNLATAYGLHALGAAALHHERNGNRALADEIEFIGRIAFCEHDVFLGELDVFSASGDEVQMFVRQSVENGCSLITNSSV